MIGHAAQKRTTDQLAHRVGGDQQSDDCRVWRQSARRKRAKEEG